MKYKVIGIVMILVMLASAAAAGAMDSENPKNRVHQHQTARQPEEGCDCDGTELCTHLPLVIINTGGEAIPGEPIQNHYEPEEEQKFTLTSDGEEMLKARISIMEDDSRNHHPSDEPDLETSMLIRVRGNSSRYFDKKNYLIRLTDDTGKYENHEVMGMEPHYEWALHGPYLDKSLIRNYMWYNIAGEMMDYAPNVRFCEVIVNGEYIGLYVMMETITNGENCRIDVSEPVDGTTQTGYLLRLDRGSSTEIKNINNFTEYTYRLAIGSPQVINIVYPRSGDLTQELADAIEQDFSDFEKGLYSYDYDTHDYGYYHEIDIDSFIDYFLLTEFTANYDAGNLSTYMYKDIGGKYKMVVWDYNSACDNYNSSVIEPQHFRMQNAVWFFMLMKDEYFTESTINRYRELRVTYFNEEYLNQYIDDVVAYLGDAVERNFEVWGYTLYDDMIEPEERNPRSFEEAVQQIKDFINVRGTWLDEYIETITQYSHYSKNKRFNH